MNCASCTRELRDRKHIRCCGVSALLRFSPQTLCLAASAKHQAPAPAPASTRQSLFRAATMFRDQR